MALNWVSRWNQYAELVEVAASLDRKQTDAFVRRTLKDENEAEAFLSWLSRASTLVDRMPEPGEGLGDIEFLLQPGEEVGEWNVEKPLGYGGMGEIYRVSRERDGFRQVAALKLVSSNDAVQKMRFQEERRILSSLEHAGVGRFIDGGETTDNRPYMVVEIVDGDIITQYADANELSGKSRLRIFADLCAAVSHAHSRLILHRDIKPANILVTQSGSVKLIDFGIGTDVEGSALSGSTPLSGGYSAPELRDKKPATVQTDIFSLGVVLDELLSGRDDLPSGDVTAVIRKATGLAPDERYSSVDAFYDDVLALMAGLPVTARQRNLFYIAERFIARHTFATFASALAVLSLIIGIIGTSVMADRARTESELAKAALVELKKARQDQLFEARTLRGYRYALQSLYGENSAIGERLPATVIDATLADIVEETSSRSPSNDDAYLIYAIGQNHLFRHDYKAAVGVFERLNPETIDDPILRMEFMSDKAHALLETGEEKRALELARSALSLRTANEDWQGPGWIQDLATIASVTGASQDRERLINVLNEAISEFDPSSADPDDVSWLYNKLGNTLLQQKRYKEATRAFAQSFEKSRDQKVLSPNDIVRATNLAQFQVYFDRNSAHPLDYLPEYLELQVSTFDNDPERRGFILGLMAEAYLLQGDWSQASQNAGLAKRVLANNRLYRAGWYFDVSLMNIRALAGEGKFGEAADELADFQKDVATAFADGPPELLQCKTKIAASLIDDRPLKALEAARSYCYEVTDSTSGSRQIILTHLLEAETIVSRR